ncbi:MAG: universal stress protein [Anaerolineales bacterium]|nr:universal stress protein [Anaerolineales bacterium]MDP3185366.1 universal stress protein [Anaerolineales bacterium]
MMTPRKRHRFNILLADDGSEHARAAVALLGDLPLPSECLITVFRAFASTQAAEVTLLEEALAQTCSLLQNKGLQTKSELMLGYPAEKIVEYAEEHRPDLIVIGAKGLRATLGILLGGVAQQVVEYACCPVLIVRAPYNSLRRVLLVSDGSAYSQEAVKYLGKFPLPGGVSLHAMHVLQPMPFPIMVAEPSYSGLAMVGPLPVPEEVAAQRAREEKEGQALLDRMVKNMKTLGLAATTVLKRGDAATEIIAYAKDQKIDLIVTGSRGLSQFKSWLMGSVSRKLVHYSGCSVLVVRGAQPA